MSQLGADLAQFRADLFDALAIIPDVAAYSSVPDAADLPAVWIDQPAGARGEPGTLAVAYWETWAATDAELSVDVATFLDDMLGVLVTQGLTVTNLRFNGWTRGDVQIGGAPVPAVTVQWITDHVLC